MDTSKYLHGIPVAQFTPDLFRGKHFIFHINGHLRHPPQLGLQNRNRFLGREVANVKFFNRH